MSVKRYRFFGQVQEINESGETIDAGWSVFHPWIKYEDYAALLAATQWRPIETAPKKETVWVFGIFDLHPEGEIWTDEYPFHHKATHWMPLPKPPSV